MAEPNIVAFRIDERLIHGQGQLWIKALGANTVIVADDGASEDPMQQMLMKAVVPKTIAMRFFSVQHTCDDHEGFSQADHFHCLQDSGRCAASGKGRRSGEGDQCGKYPQSSRERGDQQIYRSGRG